MIRLIKLFITLLFILLPDVLLAATLTSASCSLTDVTSAYNAASAGDIVVIPPGQVTWSSGITISKSITLIGAGMDSTVINNSGTNTLITISLNSDVVVRVSGIYFKFSTNNTGGQAIRINGNTKGNLSLTKIRIDHNRFEKGSSAIYPIGWTYGVIDNNQFVNCNISILIVGDDNYSWSRPIEAGTANALFIEDNTFTVNNNADREPNEQIYHQQGARTVIRNNSFDGSAYTNGNFLPYDSHGNQNYYYGSTQDFRGQPIIEFYNNTIKAYKTYRFFAIRSGSSLFWNNTLMSSTTVGKIFSFTEEESWMTAMFSPLRATWPAEDQVTNSFIWNNTINGAAITSISLWNELDTPFIQQNRDYFMHAPASSGGKSIYPTRKGASDMTFSSAGFNAYYPYIPYSYPHPLTKVQPPKSIFIP